MFQECVNFLKIGLPNTIELITPFPDTPLQVFADKTKIFQAIMNLLTNGMHAIELANDKRIGEISIGTQFFSIDQDATGFLSLKPGRYIRLTIKDTGCGIHKQEIPKIFDPYFTTKKIGKGTGMGLSIAQGIIRAHGGEIMVESTLGKGSCFTIFLACQPLCNTKNIPSQKTMNLEGKGTILFVDDEPALVKIHTRLLENFGYQVIGFTDPLAAKERFEKTPDSFDL